MLFTTYCNTKFFMPKLKAWTVFLIPRADTVLHIYRNNKLSLLTDSLSGTNWKIQMSKWISTICCVSQEEMCTAALCVHQSCMSDHPGDDYATLLLDDISSILCSSSHVPADGGRAGLPQRRPGWTATEANLIQVTKIRLFALLTLVLAQIPTRRDLNRGSVEVCMQSEEGGRFKRVWCTEMSHRGKQCCCSIQRAAPQSMLTMGACTRARKPWRWACSPTVFCYFTFTNFTTSFINFITLRGAKNAFFFPLSLLV